MFAPLILTLARWGINATIVRVNDCTYSNGGMDPCFLNGTDVSNSIYEFSTAIGFVIIPGIILWMILVGLIIFVFNIVDGRKKEKDA